MKPWMVVRYKNPEFRELEGAELTASGTKAKNRGLECPDQTKKKGKVFAISKK